jgi:zinc transport system permease protein
MLEMFSYGFLQRAFLVAILISIMTPLVGNVIVLKRLSSVGDALAHNSLAGVAIGLFLGMNPVFFAVIISIVAALIIEVLRRAFPKYSEIATNVVLSLGVGLAAVFSSFTSSAVSFNSFLFGSIVMVSNEELYTILFLGIIVTIVSIKFYNELLYITFDEEGAILAGVKVKMINLIHTILVAVVISISARTVGALVMSSLIVLPVATSMQISNSYKSNLILSIIFAIIFTTVGIVISYVYDLKPGGTITLVGVAILVLTLLANVILRKIRQKLAKRKRDILK